MNLAAMFALPKNHMSKSHRGHPPNAKASVPTTTAPRPPGTVSSRKRNDASTTAPESNRPTSAGVYQEAGRNSTAYSADTPKGTLRLSSPAGEAASSAVATAASNAAAPATHATPTAPADPHAPTAPATSAAPRRPTPRLRPAPAAPAPCAANASTAAHDTKLAKNMTALPISVFSLPASASGRFPKRLPATAANPSPNAMQNTPSAPTNGRPIPNENRASSVSDAA